MTDNHDSFDNTLEFIRSCVKRRRILWIYHVNMRLKKRFIARESIVASTDYFEIIEEYPRDKYLPSYLVYAKFEEQVFHILFAVDIEADNVRVVTAYRPNPKEWEHDLKTRRQPK